jgi:3-deoxy-D-manno-octulosonic-acid transferase
MAMLLYRIFYLPALLLALPYYTVGKWRRGGYRKGLGHRFGRLGRVPPKSPGCRRVWIQAVSVGELLAVEPLIRSWSRAPGIEVVLTTTTSTGLRLLEERFHDLTVWRGLFPMDFLPFSRAAWRRLEPDLAVLMEGELWPEHIHQAQLRRVPVVLVNARLSDRSFDRHMRLRGLARPYLSKLTAILAGSETDMRRFRQLGWLDPRRIEYTGNLKFDLDPPEPVGHEERRVALQEFGFSDAEEGSQGIRVLLGASTWPGEELALVRAWLNLCSEFPHWRLLLVPRHAERRKAIEVELNPLPLRLHFRSDAPRAPAGTQVYIADTTGELKRLTRFADLVVIGKSLPPNHGGQTPIEAAALGKPLIVGPDMSNFRDITRQLLEARAAVRVDGGEGLEAALRRLLPGVDERALMGRRAAACIASSRGAVERTRKRLEEWLNQPA